jgi:hypothetical protein
MGVVPGEHAAPLAQMPTGRRVRLSVWTSAPQRGTVHDEAGGYAKLTRDVLLIAAEAMRDKWWTGLLGPLTLAVPVVTLVNCVREAAFGRLWAGRVLRELRGRHRPIRLGMLESVLGEEG